MKEFTLYDNHTAAPILTEPSAWEGVRRVAGVIRADLSEMAGRELPLCDSLGQAAGPDLILAAAVGRSPLLDSLASRGLVRPEDVAGKREVFSLQIVPDPFPERPDIRRLLLVLGSDKRGTEYGLFELEERCGVSPLVWWGDVRPPRRDRVSLTLPEPFTSREPSVRYRGFFINDEWPAFGRWCNEKFGGFNARCYEQVFLLLLRLRGNYLWPAMWSAVFSEDGPGLENARLADIYGVVMGTSHHEPLCRAGEEWKQTWQRYGGGPEWSFLTNAEAISRFWEDGVRRNRDFENVITVGMRGEADSKLLGEDATLADNIDAVKRAVLAQHQILRHVLGPDLSRVPRVLAVYKEVEEFWYGDADTPGLRCWPELADVIFLLSDDNFGNLRTLPRPGDPPHPGGYGMYYHFDYHGEPISYEWLCGNPLPKIREQMTCAWELGVRELWVVNVGDLKGSELPLSYFLSLAYDYDAWSGPEPAAEYTRLWTKRQFPDAPEDTVSRLAALMEGWSRLNALRRPEALTPDAFHPVRFREAERIWRLAGELEREAEALPDLVPERLRDAALGMICLPALLTANLARMNIEAAWNQILGERGCVYADTLADSVTARIARDRELIGRFHTLAGGKWDHMLDSAHYGFRTWDDHDWRWPAVCRVTPIPGPGAAVTVRGCDRFYLGRHWQERRSPEYPVFLDPAVREAAADLHLRGTEGFAWTAVPDSPCLAVEPASGRVSAGGPGLDGFRIVLLRDGPLPPEASVRVDIEFDGGSSACARLRFPLTGCPAAIRLDAAGFTRAHETPQGRWAVLPGLGRLGDAVKPLPAGKTWSREEDRPWAEYDLDAGAGGEFVLELHTLARNPLARGDRLTLDVSLNGGAPIPVHTVSETFRTGDGGREWGEAVLTGARVTRLPLALFPGVNRLRVMPVSPNVILERVEVLSTAP